MKKFIALVLSIIITAGVVLTFTGSSVSERINPTLTVSAKNISYELSDNLYGLSLDGSSYYGINGGLVSQLVANNSFEYAYNPAAGWNMNVSYTDFLFKNNPAPEHFGENNKNFIQLTVDDEGSIENLGYTEIFNDNFKFNNKKAKTGDMGFVKGEAYAFSAYFENYDYIGTITVSLKAEGNTEKYEFNIDECTEWTKISLEMVSEVTADGSLLLEFEGNGSFNMDFVSLVPVESYGDTRWKYVSLRQDLFDAIKGLSPSFVRFYETESGWKNTIGPLESRSQESTAFKQDNRYYVNPNAMGFYEYMLLCEDLDALAVPVFNMKPEEDFLEKAIPEVVTQPVEEQTAAEGLDPAVENILDFIEYATGDKETEWGVKRAEDGHPEPFELEYIALDGEDFYEPAEALSEIMAEGYPQIKIIICDDTLDDEARTRLSTGKGNIIFDENYADEKSPYNSTDKYDEYERSVSKLTVTDFNSNADGLGSIITSNNIWSALENTAFLLGLEKNSDIVEMASYKSVLQKQNAQEGETSLVWFDSQDLLLSTDYYAQMLFANNMGTHYIASELNGDAQGLYHSVTVDTQNKVIYVKLVNSTKKPQTVNIDIDDFKQVGTPTAQYMTETFKSACNEPDQDLHTAPVEAELTKDEENVITYDVGSLSVNVIRIPYDGNDGAGLYELPETDVIVPYIPSTTGIVISVVVIAFVLITGAIILLVRMKHHKKMRK